MRLLGSTQVTLLAMTSFVDTQRYAGNQRSIVRDPPLVAVAFPDVDIDLRSPAFLSPETVPTGFANNAAGPTDQATLENFLRVLAQSHSRIKYHDSPSLRSEEGRSLPYVKLSTSHKSTGNLKEKLRVYFQGGVHGDEPGGDQAILALLGKFSANETWALSVLDKIDLLVLPRYNPDGVAYFQRQLGTSYDGNRDHALLQRKQTRDLKKLLNDFDPHVGLDAHEYTVKNPNIHANIRHLGEELFVNTVFDTVKAAGFRTGPYFVTGGSGDNIRLTEPSSISQAGHNSWGLGQTLTFLTETRGILLGDQHFHRRVAAGFTAAETIIQVAVDNADLVYRTIENARREFINSQDDIIVLDRARVTNTTIEFVDNISGAIVDIPVQFNNNTSSEVVLSRARPEAYIFPPGFSDVAERLRILGVEVDVVAQEWTGTVETLTVESVTLASSRHEGVVQSTVTTTPGSREVKFPPGAFLVSTRQKNAAFAFVALEPENISSFVTYNIIPLERGEEYPVFRIF